MDGVVRVTIVMALVALTPTLAAAQILPPASPAARVELGFTRQYQHRNFRYTDGHTQVMDWSRDAVYVRLGLTRYLSLELNGLAWHRGSTSRFPQRDYVTYTFGGNLTVKPMTLGGFAFGVGVGGHEQANLDQSPTRYDKRHRELALTVGATRRFRLWGLDAMTWAGPCYVVEWLSQYPATDPATHAKSMRNTGGVGGVALVLGRRIRWWAQLAYFDYWQSQTGLGVVL